jgi:KDO2-lipid IV(A) lauroyltransferase
MKRPEEIATLPLVGLLWGLSWLPLRVLYVLSSAVAFLLYHVAGYRRRVVRDNLRKAFPEKGKQELRRISRAFYLHFSDLFFETIWLLHATEKQARRHYAIEPEGLRMMNAYARQGRSVVLLYGHYGNWEWSGLPARYDIQACGVPAYRPLKNKVFDRFMLQVRARYAHEMAPLKQVVRILLRLQQEGKPLVVGLIADQSPDPRHAHWTTFMNQDTAVNDGPEKLASRMKLPVFYLSIHKEKRGFYRMTFREVAPHPADLPEGEVSRRFMALLEQDIRQNPAAYLWSHRRWKHQRPV